MPSYWKKTAIKSNAIEENALSSISYNSLEFFFFIFIGTGITTSQLSSLIAGDRSRQVRNEDLLWMCASRRNLPIDGPRPFRGGYLRAISEEHPRCRPGGRAASAAGMNQCLLAFPSVLTQILRMRT